MPDDVTAQTPWHEGEIALQKRFGSFDQMADVGPRFIRDAMPDQHRRFFQSLPFLAVGTVDERGYPWASIVTGAPGFVTAPDNGQLDIAAMLDDADPARAGLTEGAAIGLLGIELSNRRRNRMNGHVSAVGGGESGFSVAVEHSFGNCPKYIQLRQWQTVETNTESAGSAEELSALDADARALIAAADTFFVASYADTGAQGRQIDVSHRGGKPGFVRIDANGTLTIPDFSGNRFFNTLGNILASGKAGLLFIDFATSDLLQLSGEAELVLEGDEIADYAGAERLWRVHPEHIVRRQAAITLRWTLDANPLSPFLAHTGSWDADAAPPGLVLEVAQIVDESAVVRSLYLRAADGAPLPDWKAGQHLTLSLPVAGEAKPLTRSYTISSAPSDGVMRLSIKRQGLASTHMHSLPVGSIIEARRPAGGFTIDAHEARPTVLIAAGVGVTPIVAMARHLLAEGQRSGSIRPTTIFHPDRTIGARPFDAELPKIALAAGGAIRLIRLLTDVRGAEIGADFDHQGRLNITLLKSELGFDDYDFYICGPGGFMQAIYDGLTALNIADKRIHAEAFGPSGLQRRPRALAQDARHPATEPVSVRFARSGKQVIWKPGDGTLLELAEREGLTPENSCRAGSCGSCAVRLLKGDVAYPNGLSATPEAGKALICSALPSGNIELDI